MEMKSLGVLILLGFVILCWNLESQQAMVRRAIDSEKRDELNYYRAVEWKFITTQQFIDGVRVGMALGKNEACHKPTSEALKEPNAGRGRKAASHASNKNRICRNSSGRNLGDAATGGSRS